MGLSVQFQIPVNNPVIRLIGDKNLKALQVCLKSLFDLKLPTGF